MSVSQVIAVMDVGKTNKKLFLFDKDYNIVHEQSARFNETTDEDGDPCENLESLRLSVFDSLRAVMSKKKFEIKAVNFSAYGASLVYIDENGMPLTPLYNYLKSYPNALKDKFYKQYGGEEKFSSITASPVLGSLNSGMQLYRMKYEKPEIFAQIRYALHLPQYLAYLLSGKPLSDMTSIGCHTNFWDFEKNDYHDWVDKEGIRPLLAPIAKYDEVMQAGLYGNNYVAGIGLHDSSAALIPYLLNFREPFVLISTGTWSISLNPFNRSPLTVDELKKDCLCYLDFKGNPVKASRLFAGHMHDEQVKRICAHFNTDPLRYRNLAFDSALVSRIKKSATDFEKRELTDFVSDSEAYHALILDLVSKQYESTELVLSGTRVKRIFVDGGFGKNVIYMHLLAAAFPDTEIFAASMPQATAMGAALALHSSWNDRQIPSDLIELKYYAVTVQSAVGN